MNLASFLYVLAWMEGRLYPVEGGRVCKYFRESEWDEVGYAFEWWLESVSQDWNGMSEIKQQGVWESRFIVYTFPPAFVSWS